MTPPPCASIALYSGELGVVMEGVKVAAMVVVAPQEAP